jgi:hypothetical protein
VNVRRDTAIVTFGACGVRAALLRMVAGQWKIVRMQDVLQCATRR